MLFLQFDLEQTINAITRLNKLRDERIKKEEEEWKKQLEEAQKEEEASRKRKEARAEELRKKREELEKQELERFKQEEAERQKLAEEQRKVPAYFTDIVLVSNSSSFNSLPKSAEKSFGRREKSKNFSRSDDSKKNKPTRLSLKKRKRDELRSIAEESSNKEKKQKHAIKPCGSRSKEKRKTTSFAEDNNTSNASVS